MRISDWSSDVCSSDLPGGVILHIGLGDSERGLDVRRATLQEVTFIGTYTYTMTDFADTLAALAAERLGAQGWVEPRPLADGRAAFRDLDRGRVAAAKLALEPMACRLAVGHPGPSEGFRALAWW